MRLWLVALIVLAPVASADVSVYEELLDASVGEDHAGAGSCERGAPAYAQRHEAYAQNMYGGASARAACERADRSGPGAREGRREVALSAWTDAAALSFSWTSEEKGPSSACAMELAGALVLGAECVAGGPPAIPVLA